MLSHSNSKRSMSFLNVGVSNATECIEVLRDFNPCAGRGGRNAFGIVASGRDLSKPELASR